MTQNQNGSLMFRWCPSTNIFRFAPTSSRVLSTQIVSKVDGAKTATLSNENNYCIQEIELNMAPMFVFSIFVCKKLQGFKVLSTTYPKPTYELDIMWWTFIINMSLFCTLYLSMRCLANPNERCSHNFSS